MQFFTFYYFYSYLEYHIISVMSLKSLEVLNTVVLTYLKLKSYLLMSPLYFQGRFGVGL